MIIWECEKEEDKDATSEVRLTVHFLAGGTLNCCSLHYTGHLGNGLGRSQDEWRIVRLQRRNLRAGLFDPVCIIQTILSLEMIVY